MLSRATPWSQAQAECTQSVASSWNLSLKICFSEQTEMPAVMLIKGTNPSMVLSTLPWGHICSLGWLWRSTSGSMLGSKGCRKRRWKRRWSRWQQMLVCLTNWKLGQAGSQVGSDLLHFSASETHSIGFCRGCVMDLDGILQLYIGYCTIKHLRKSVIY